MKKENKVIRFNDFIRNRKSRLFISLLAIGHGIIRISDRATFTPASFGNDILFGTLLITLGILLAITSFMFSKYEIPRRIVTTLLAAVYASLTVAMIDKNIGSAYTTFMIVVFLLIEEIFIYEH